MTTLVAAGREVWAPKKTDGDQWCLFGGWLIVAIVCLVLVSISGPVVNGPVKSSPHGFKTSCLGFQVIRQGHEALNRSPFRFRVFGIAERVRTAIQVRGQGSLQGAQLFLFLARFGSIGGGCSRGVVTVLLLLFPQFVLVQAIPPFVGQFRWQSTPHSINVTKSSVAVAGCFKIHLGSVRMPLTPQWQFLMGVLQHPTIPTITTIGRGGEMTTNDNGSSSSFVRGSSSSSFRSFVGTAVATTTTTKTATALGPGVRFLLTGCSAQSNLREAPIASVEGPTTNSGSMESNTNHH